jgi:hypothetical protein
MELLGVKLVLFRRFFGALGEDLKRLRSTLAAHCFKASEKLSITIASKGCQREAGGALGDSEVWLF